MKEYRDDIRARAKAAGRNPDDIKLLFVVSPTIAATEAEARAKVARFAAAPNFVEKALVGISSNTEIDFKQFDLDEPLPEGLTTNGERGSLEHFMRGDGRPGPKTLRQLGPRADHPRARTRRHRRAGRRQDGRGRRGDRR